MYLHVPTLLIVSIVLQLAAAGIAVSYVRLTGWRSPWLVLAFAMLLQALRRWLTLSAALEMSSSVEALTEPAVISLSISVVMLVGVVMIRPMLRRIYDTNRVLNEQVEERTQALVLANENLASLNEEMEAMNEELMSSNEELESAYQEVQRINDSREHFMASMAHEFKTPLNSINGFSKVLKDGMAGPVNEEQARQLEMIGEAGERLMGLVTDLLDMERANADLLELHTDVFDPREMIRRATNMLAPSADAKGLELTFDDQGLAAEFQGDRRRIEQIVFNLVSNAVKYTPEGSVHVRASSGADGTMLIEVEDTGPGIPAAQRQRVFDEFVQLEGAQVAAARGTGLGLAIARRLARLHGGDVTLGQTQGLGSLFVAKLAPLAL